MPLHRDTEVGALRPPGAPPHIPSQTPLCFCPSTCQSRHFHLFAHLLCMVCLGPYNVRESGVRCAVIPPQQPRPGQTDAHT